MTKAVLFLAFSMAAFPLAARSPAQDAPQRGYRPGFTGGSGNHRPLPGNASFYLENAARTPIDSRCLTGLWTNRVERGKVFEALLERHTWAAWDTRALVYFTVNGGEDLRALQRNGGIIYASPGFENISTAHH